MVGLGGQDGGVGHDGDKHRQIEHIEMDRWVRDWGGWRAGRGVGERWGGVQDGSKENGLG